METNRIADGLLWFIAFLFSTTVHEASHAWVAWRGGDPTAYQGGQVSLSPIPHIRREPIGMLVVPLLTALTQGWAIGWASTPYDPHWEARHPKRAALMAAAGPAANLLLAAIAFVILKAGLLGGVFGGGAGAPADAGAIGLVFKILLVMLILNVLLFFFNLLPFPPLDGGSAIGLFLPESLAEPIRNFGRTPGFSLMGLLIAWVAFPKVANPIVATVIDLLRV